MTKSINIVIGNHAGSRGITDYVHYLRFTLQKMGINVAESIYPKVHTDANFWIEEFGTSSEEFLAFSAAKFPPSYLVCSEWPSPYRSFDIFNFRERLFALALLLFPIRFVVTNTLLPKGRFSRMVAQLLAVPLISFGILLGFSRRRSFYQMELSARFIALKKVAHKAAGLIVINELLADAYKLHFPEMSTYTLTPLLSKSWLPLGDNTERDRISIAWAFVSGNLTRHRARWIDRAFLSQRRVTTIPPYLSRTFSRVDKTTIGTELANIFRDNTEHAQNAIFIGYYSHSSFLDNIANNLPEKTFFLEIYIGQTKNWFASSPMRDYRALRKGYIPISSGSYQGQIFGNLVIAAPKNPNDFIEFLHNLEIDKLIKSMPTLVDQHNTRFLPSNRKVIDGIL